VSDNRPRLYTIMCAAHWLGAVVVPLFQDAAEHELLGPLQSTQATHVFAEDQEQVDKILALLPWCPAIRCIIYDKDRGMRHYQQPQLVNYAALLQAGQASAAAMQDGLNSEAARGAGTDPAFVIFTTDAAGPAKGVVLSHSALIDRARAAAAVDSLSDADVVLAYLPPAWIGQTLVSYAQPLAVGYCVCCPESSETMLSDLREIGPTYFMAPPRLLEAIANDAAIRMEGASLWTRSIYRSFMAVANNSGAQILSRTPVFFGSRLAYGLGDLLVYAPLRGVLGMSRVRVAYTSGDEVAPHVLMFFRAIGINLKQTYGSTETAFFVAMQRDGAVKPGSLGQPLAGVDVKFTPDRELLVRSAGLFKEYLADPDATQRAISPDGWFHTGDAGYLGDDGELRIIDRLRDIGTLTNGAMFAPKMIENKLKASRYIKEAVAFGAGRDRVSALIDIDAATVGSWAEQRNLSYTGYADLAALDEVYGLIEGEIARVNAALAQEPTNAHVQVRRFIILHKPLDADDGSLSRMRRLRRDVVEVRYGPLADAMNSGSASFRFHDGDANAPIVELAIRDVAAGLAVPANKKAA
jgi:long-chain acyl-CoA synthetase